MQEPCAGLRIRAARQEDAAQLLAIYAPYVRDTAVTFAYEPPTLEEFGQVIARTLSRYPYLVAELEGVPVGYAYASPFKTRDAYDWDCELSIYVRADCRRSGAGRALYEMLQRALAAQGVFNLYACIARTRTPDAHLSDDSIRFHTRMGFSTVAHFDDCGYKFGRWYDMIWMHKALLAPPPAVPPARLDFAHVRGGLGL